MKEYLNQFSKRMEVVAVVDSIVKRLNRNQEIEKQFSADEVDNILMSILVFIMETTLTEEQDCTIEAIAGFIFEILPSYGKQMNFSDCEVLSRYLIKDILQNKGETRTSRIMEYDYGMKGFPVRLVSDKLGEKDQILYELTKQGFDFLFRTKEVDDELGFEIEAIRLRMLISKKNYKKATSQSKYVIAMLLEKRNELRQFEQQLRHDVFSVSGEQYDTVIREVNTMLSDEYNIMLEIEQLLKQAQAHLDEEIKMFSTVNEKSLVAQREIRQISENVRRALDLQRELLIKCEDLRKLYIVMLQDALALHQIKRFDIEEQIIEVMETLSFSGATDLFKFRAGLLSPLLMPNVKKTLNLSLVYQRQAKLRETDESDVYDEDETTSNYEKLELIRQRNDAHALVVFLLLDYAGTHCSFDFADFWNHIKTHERISDMTMQRLVFLDMLKLYEMQVIDFSKWRMEENLSLDCMGEFDFDYCLARCMEKNSSLFDIKQMAISKAGTKVICEIDSERVSMDNLNFEVIKMEDIYHEADSSNT